MKATLFIAAFILAGSVCEGDPARPCCPVDTQVLTLPDGTFTCVSDNPPAEPQSRHVASPS